STPELNPNLVRIYLDAQHDYLEDRIYLLGALVVACKDDTPTGRRAVVRMTNGPPDSAAKERQLFVTSTRELVQAVVDLAAPVPGTVQGPVIRLPGQAGHRRHVRVVHAPVSIQQFRPVGVRLRRLEATAQAETGPRRRVRRLPGGHAGPAASLPGEAAGGLGT